MRARAAAALLIGLAAALLACPDAGPPRRQALVLVLDAARPDRFSIYGHTRDTTPAMDALARKGAVFLNHYVQGTATRSSVPSYLYSRYFVPPIFPRSRHVPYSDPRDLFQGLDEAAISFPKAFEAAGFLTAAISAHTWTGPETRFASEFMEMHPLGTTIDGGRYGYPKAPIVIDYAIQWIGAHIEEDFLLYVHLMDTHFPHFLEEDAQAYFGASTYESRHIGKNGWIDDLSAPFEETDRRYLDALYDGSLRYADRHVGRLLTYLEQRGLLDRMLIAITSDHGENLLEGPGTLEAYGPTILTHGGPWFEGVARIPLILYYPPAVRPGTHDVLSEAVDLGPTLTAAFGIELPAGKSFDGVDLGAVAAGRADARPRSVSRLGIRTRTHKLILESPVERLLGAAPPAPGAIRASLYDLAADPTERSDLFGTRPELVGDLLARYRDALRVPYARFLAARVSDPPAGAFAIGSRFFVASGNAPGWNALRLGRDECLRSTGPDPLPIAFALPIGRYALSIQLEGRAEVEVAGRRLGVEGDGPSLQDLGLVEVEEESFQARVQPVGDEPVSVCFLGFAPAEAAFDEDPERLERLRALGYVE